MGTEIGKPSALERLQAIGGPPPVVAAVPTAFAPAPVVDRSDDLAPILVTQTKAGIANKAVEKLQRLSKPPKQAKVPKPSLGEAAKLEKQADDAQFDAAVKQKQDEAKAAQQAETGGEPAGGGGISAVLRDVGAGAVEAFTFVPAHNALLTGAVNAIDEVGDSLADMALYPFGYSHKDLDQAFGVIETTGPTSVTGQLIEGVTQFAVGMFGVGKALKALGLATTGGQAAQSVARGAIADVAAFDESSARLSDLVQQFPVLRNPVTEYLAGDPDDGFVEAKFKQAMEGAIGGTISETLFRGLKAYRGYAALKAAQPKAVAQKAIRAADVEAVTEGALELTPRDWVQLGGNPDSTKPLIEVTGKSIAQGERLIAEIGPEGLSGMLDELRNTGVPQPTGIASFLRQAGGLRKTAEVEAAWNELQRARPGLVSGKGMKIGEAVDAAIDAGFMEPREGVPGIERADELLDLIERNVKGEVVGASTDPALARMRTLEDLSSQMDELGLNPGMTNEEIEAGLRAGAARTKSAPAGEAALDIAEEADADNLFAGDLPRTAEMLDEEIAAGAIEAIDVPGQIKVGNRVANINLNRVEGPDGLREAAQKIGQMMVEDGRIGPTVTQTTDQARKLSNILLTDENTMRTWLVEGKSATGRAFSREEIIGAGEVMTQNLKASRNLALKIAKGGATDVDKLAFHRMFALQQSMMSLVSQQSREAGRALQAFRTTVGGNKAAARAIRDIMQSEGNTEKMAAMVLTMEHPGQQAKYMKDMVEGGGGISKAGNAMMEIFYNGILSGPRTHMVNIIGNSMNPLTAVAERSMASRLPGSSIPRGEATALLWGQLRSTKDAFKVAASVFRTGVPLQDAAANSVIKRRAITAEKFGVNRGGNIMTDALAAGIDLLGTAIRLPGRALMTSDEFWKTIARGGETNALAFRRATSEGLTGKAFAERVHDLRINPPPDIVDKAFDFAAYQTFTKPLGQSGAAVQRILTQNRWANIVVPFVQTPINILKYASARSPFGYLMKSVRDDIAAGGASRDLALAQIGLGSMVMATAADYAAQGSITGAAPSDPGLKAAWDRAGILPYAIKVPGTDTWMQYTRLDPVGFTVGMAADLSTIMSQWSDLDGLELGGPRLEDIRTRQRARGRTEEQINESIDRLQADVNQGGRITPDRVIGAAVAALKNNMLSRSYLSGMADLFGAFEAPSPEMQADSLGRYVQRAALGFVPFSSALRTAEQVVSPQLNDAQTLVDAFWSMIPGFSEGYAPVPDLWGRERLASVGLSPIAVREEEDSPADKEFMRLRMPVNMPAKDIQGTRMTPEEYSTFVKLAGDGVVDPSTGLTARGTIDAMVTGTHPSPGVNAVYADATDGPDGGKATIIRDTFTQFRKLAREKIVRESESLRLAISLSKQYAKENVTGQGVR